MDELDKKEFKILFFTSQLRARELKLAHGLKFLGCHVDLVFVDATPFQPTDSFKSVHKVCSPLEALRVAKRLHPSVVHVFSGAVDAYASIFCANKFAPTIIDLNDIFSASLMDYCHDRFEMTEKILSLADGYCGRDLQIKIVEKNERKNVPRENIFFPEYCWNLNQKRLPKLSMGELHVVSVGTLCLETHGMYDCAYLEMVKLFIEQKIHFHIYPHWSYKKKHNGNFEKDYADFIELAKSTSYLHLHESLEPIDLLIEISQYHIGIVAGGCVDFGQKYTCFQPAYVESCFSGRIADYLDAGLPVLINKEVKFNYQLMNHYGVCFNLNKIFMPDFQSQLTDFINNPTTLRYLEMSLERFSIAKNAYRLLNFYLDLNEKKSYLYSKEEGNFSLAKRIKKIVNQLLFGKLSHAE